MRRPSTAGDVEQLKQLLAVPGVDVDQKDEEGRTALHFAAGYVQAGAAGAWVGGVSVELQLHALGGRGRG